ncbi:MAG: SUMF1/EgtB/PvdO family nonheme iron enzyme [Candidatus Omnitrophota bacterium]
MFQKSCAIKREDEIFSVKIKGAFGEVEIKFVQIPADEFVMGSPRSEKNHEDDEAPIHKVQFSKPFYLGIYEVTQEQ